MLSHNVEDTGSPVIEGTLVSQWRNVFRGLPDVFAVRVESGCRVVAPAGAIERWGISKAHVGACANSSKCDISETRSTRLHHCVSCTWVEGRAGDRKHQGRCSLVCLEDRRVEQVLASGGHIALRLDTVAFGTDFEPGNPVACRGITWDRDRCRERCIQIQIATVI